MSDTNGNGNGDNGNGDVTPSGPGWPNNLPAYFPAFTVEMPPPYIGWGNWQPAPSIPFPITEGPPQRIPPFPEPPNPTPTPTPPAAGAEFDEYMESCELEMTTAGVPAEEAVAMCEQAWVDAGNELPPDIEPPEPPETRAAKPAAKKRRKR